MGWGGSDGQEFMLKIPMAGVVGVIALTFATTCDIPHHR